MLKNLILTLGFLIPFTAQARSLDATFAKATADIQCDQTIEYGWEESGEPQMGANSFIIPERPRFRGRVDQLEVVVDSFGRVIGFLIHTDADDVRLNHANRIFKWALKNLGEPIRMRDDVARRTAFVWPELPTHSIELMLVVPNPLEETGAVIALGCR